MHVMKVAILCTNLFNIDEKNKTGSGIFNYILIRQLAAMKGKGLGVTVFASGDSSSLPVPVESVDQQPSSADPELMRHGKHVMFELALLSKAFSRQEDFDAYHMSFGDGDMAVPFAPFVRKPIIVTLHNIADRDFTRKYFSIFAGYKNVYFVSTSVYQRKLLPALQYIDTIYHGIDTEQFAFDPAGGEDIMWAGRFIPEKGAADVLRLAKEANRSAKLFGVVKQGHEEWFSQHVERPAADPEYRQLVSLHIDTERSKLVTHFQNSKLFILPTLLEEAFGLVFAESMACGTPVVTYARGAAPEVIRDGETGFLVNPSDEDIRGDWVIKKTGYEGLREAVERIYSLSAEEYARMRRACREHAASNFSAERMAERYIEVYKKVSK
ncbi:MAG TPA: glycosyltransferase [Candidatus Paceibacterota bacterium]|nr:glycosyltransferase [Candidatus Paceibacterota bacterium]